MSYLNDSAWLKERAADILLAIERGVNMPSPRIPAGSHKLLPVIGKLYAGEVEAAHILGSSATLPDRSTCEAIVREIYLYTRAMAEANETFKAYLGDLKLVARIWVFGGHYEFIVLEYDGKDYTWQVNHH